MRGGHVLRVEIVWKDRSAQHHIVVQVQKVVGKPGNAVQMRLDRRAAERWQMRFVDKQLSNTHHASVSTGNQNALPRSTHTCSCVTNVMRGFDRSNHEGI
jgi:hypothetical protein